MSMPFYVAPEQFMKDKADFARKNIGRGRPLVGVVYADGILLCAENPSHSLHKVSEIYDRIAFAGVGRYNEFDQLRRAGVQHADVKGYQFSREDVDARSLANLYAQYMGNVFTHEMKPLEVEILVAEVGASVGEDQLFHILYDGSVVDEDRLTVLGGEAEAITNRLKARLQDGWDLPTALRAAVAALAGPDRALPASDLEVAVLARTNGGRAFRRIDDDEVMAALGSLPGELAEPARAERLGLTEGGEPSGEQGGVSGPSDRSAGTEERRPDAERAEGAAPEAGEPPQSEPGQ